jgi:Bacterial Ig-like domain
MPKHTSFLLAFTVLGMTACQGDPPITLTITSPNATAYTKGTLTVQVGVSGGVPGSVTLLKNSVPLATLSAPYQYVWDTTTDPEGTYILTAKATRGAGFNGAEEFTSGPRGVIVDRTPPSVVARTPAPGSSNVEQNDPALVTFSEPINPSTANDAAVSLIAGSSSVPKALSVSSDKKTLTIKPTGTLDPDNPVTLTASLTTAITDLAGNALSIPADAWSWTLPVWWLIGGATINQDAGADASGPSLALDSSSQPVVAWAENKTGSPNVFVKRWTGSSWVLIGAGGLGALGETTQPSLALNANNDPVVAYSENIGGIAQGFVKRWNGTAWVLVGSGAVNQDSSKGAFDPSLKLDANGNPFVVWTEDGSPNNRNVFVKHWTGSSWTLVGLGTINQDPNGISSRPTIALDAGNAPVVAWSELNGTTLVENAFVKRWNGSAWALIGSGAINQDTGKSAYNPFLALDSSGSPIVASIEPGDTRSNVFVRRWTGSVWARVGAGTLNQDTTLSGLNPVLALDASGNLFASWAESYVRRPSNVYMKRWTGSAWVLVGSGSVHQDTSGRADHPSLAVNSSGKPIIALAEYPVNAYVVFVRRYNR